MNQIQAISNCTLNVRRTVKYKDADEFGKSLSFLTYSCLEAIEKIMNDCGFSVVRFGGSVRSTTDDDTIVHGVLSYGNSLYMICDGYEGFHTVCGDMSDEQASWTKHLIDDEETLALIQLNEGSAKTIGHELMCKVYRELVITLQLYSERGLPGDIEFRN